MLRVELFTVLPASPTCSMYLRQLCRFAAKIAGTRYMTKKYRHAFQYVTADTIPIHTTTIRTSSAQIRRRTFAFRIGEPVRRKARRNKNGDDNKPAVSSREAARTLPHRGLPGWTNVQSSSSRSVARFA